MPDPFTHGRFKSGATSCVTPTCRVRSANIRVAAYRSTMPRRVTTRSAAHHPKPSTHRPPSRRRSSTAARQRQRPTSSPARTLTGSGRSTLTPPTRRHEPRSHEEASQVQPPKPRSVDKGRSHQIELCQEADARHTPSGAPPTPGPMTRGWRGSFVSASEDADMSHSKRAVELTPNQTRPAPGGNGGGPLSSRRRRPRDTSATANPREAGACVLVSHFPQRRSNRMCHTCQAMGCPRASETSRRRTGEQTVSATDARLDGTRQCARCLSYIASRVVRNQY